MSKRLPSMDEVLAGLNPRKSSEPADFIVMSGDHPGPPPAAEEAADPPPTSSARTSKVAASERGIPAYIQRARAE